MGCHSHLFHRPTGKQGFLKIEMTYNNDNIYSAVIPGEEIFEPRIDYYFEATDTSGNTLSKGSASSPLAVSVVAAILPQVAAGGGAIADGNTTITVTGPASP